MFADEFRLLPWEWNITQPPAPHIEIRATFNGRRQLLRLKAVNERLFFVTNDEKERTFAVTTPLPSGLNQMTLGHFFRAELKRNNVGLLKTVAVYMGTGDQTTVAIIWNFDDSGVLAEWTSSRWIEFEAPRITSKPELQVWEKGWFSLDGAKLAGRYKSQILDAPFDRGAHLDFPPDWNGSSAKEIKQVARALGKVFPRSRANSPQSISSPDFFSHLPASALEPRETWFPENWPLRWRDVLSRFLPPIAQRWTRNEQFAPDVRRGWCLENNHSVRRHFEVANSQHERIEAFLFLRDWLCERAPSESVEDYLPNKLG